MKSPTGILTLIPTPLSEDSPLNPVALNELKKACAQSQSLFVVEEIKMGRRRWLSWGLPREQVESFGELNEHNKDESTKKIIEELKQGKNVYLMSDTGTPAFCDPGQELVNACHELEITVTATPLDNSAILALALSGFDHGQFVFAGFLPTSSWERKESLQELLKDPRTIILMDTPYRLERLLSEVAELTTRQVFLALDLNCPNQLLLRGKAETLLKKIEQQKREFILVIQRKPGSLKHKK